MEKCEVKLFYHCWPAKLVCFSAMGLWLDRWPGERELIPNMTAKTINEAFKSCLGSEPFWCKPGYGHWECSVCGVAMPGIIEAQDHPLTKEIFSQGAIEAAQARKAGQAVQPGSSVPVVSQSND